MPWGLVAAGVEMFILSTDRGIGYVRLQVPSLANARSGLRVLGLWSGSS